MIGKEEVFAKAKELMKALGFSVIESDLERPWGGFLVIDESQAQAFAKQFFPEEDFEKLKISDRLSPKILIVGPGKRLSWQYHHRRAEIWKCIEGKVAVATSPTDEELTRIFLEEGDKIKLPQLQRHRLIGLENWGVIAEIWQHTDPDNPSNEDDIIRIQDDFGR